jgi:hypothetical protein
VRAKETELGAKAMVEAHFSLEALHDLYWGTTDAAIIAPPVLWIGDLKSGGWRVQVRYADGHVNFQVGGYALGALQLVPPGVAIERIEVTICQPRNGGISSAVMSMDEVLDFAGEMLEIAEAAEAPDAPLIPGDHCQFCKASSDCPALRAGAYEAADIEFGGPPTPSEMTPEAMGKVLENAELIDLWIHAVRQRAKDDADRGVRIPGWKLVQRRGIRRWVDTDHAAASCMTYGLRGDALFEPAKLRSPAQVEKAFKAEKLTLPRDWSELVVTSDPGTALVPEADVRPAIDATPSADFATPKQEAW